MVPRIAVLLSPILLLAGCGGLPGRATQLSDRFQTQLQPELASGQAGLVRLPDGACVTLADRALFNGGSAELSDKGRYALASVMQSLLAPRLLEVDVSEPATTSTTLQQARVNAVTQFLQEWQLAPPLQFPITVQAIPTAVPQAMAITVRLKPRQS